MPVVSDKHTTLHAEEKQTHGSSPLENDNFRGATRQDLSHTPFAWYSEVQYLPAILSPIPLLLTTIQRVMGLHNRQ